MADVDLYSYNGKLCPAIPEEYATEYPEHFLVARSGSYMYCVKKIRYTINGKNTQFTGPGVMLYLNPYDNVWELRTTYGAEDEETGLNRAVKWSNVDIYSDSENTTLYMAGSPALPQNGIIGISINCADSVKRGFFTNIYATVSGNGEFSSDYTMTLSGQGASTDIIDATHLVRYDGNTIMYRLYCSDTETADTLTVTATSTQNPSFTVSKTISVLDLDGTGGDSGGTGGDGGDSGGDSGGTGGGITPTGTIEITKNGTYDVTEYASANVEVTPEGTLEITKNGTYDVTDCASVEVNVPIPVADLKAAYWSGFGTAAALYGCGK